MDALGLALIGLGILAGWSGVKGIDPRTVITNFFVNPGMPVGQEHPSATSDGTTRSGVAGVAGAVTGVTKERVEAAAGSVSASANNTGAAPKLTADTAPAPPSNALRPPPYLAPSDHRSGTA